MSAIDTWLQQPPAQAVGWALLQFVWQGTVVGALTALALAALRRSASDVRYVVASIGLALMLALPIVTGVQTYQALTAAPAPSPSSDSAVSAVSRNSEALPSLPAGTDLRLKADAFRLKAEATDGVMARLRSLKLEGFLPLLMPLWLAGVSLLSLRLFTSWLCVQRLRTRGVTPADAVLHQMISRLARRLHITRAVTLLESRMVDVPTVIGFLTPVVLLPASALAGLTTQQVEAILAHELAHIRRHDYVVNLLQTLVETVLFYHPAVWWLSRRIRIERENCCDDLAVSLCGDPVAYATALADLEALRSSGPAPERHIAMAATGGSLLQRVRRLLGAPSSHSGRAPAWLAATAALSLIGCVAYSADDRRPHDPRLAHAVDTNRRELHEIVRAVHGELRHVQTTLRAATIAMRQSARAAATARRAASADARPTVAEQPFAALPAIPAPPAIAAPAASQSVSVSQTSHTSSGNWSWTNNGDHLEVSYNGTFEFTDDDTDVRTISSGGWLKISDGKWLGRHSVEIRERGGQLEHLYYVSGASRPYEPEGHAWLQQNLPRFVRNSGFGADTRVARLLKNGGPGAVLTEIGRLEGTYVKGVYYRELFKQASLTPDQYRQVMTQAGREMKGSSYELAQLLIAIADKLPADEASRAAYFQAAAGIDSSYELRRVYATMLKRGPVSPSILEGILVSAKSIHSDYELSELLRQIVLQQPLDERTRAPFFNALSTIDSSYERHRVLSAVVGGGRASDAATLDAALTSASRIHSDYETSQFLQEVLRQNDVESVRAPFFAAVHTISGNYERGRVLQAVVRKSGTGPETLRAVLQAGRGMDGYELSQLLQAVAANHSVSGDLREAYLAAADRLGDYEQGQAMAALVRSERRK